MNPTPDASLPTLAHWPTLPPAEVLIVGGTSLGVALALGLHARGHRVQLMAPRPYLGEDLTAGQWWWPSEALRPQTTPRLRPELYPPGHAHITPGHAKLTFEQSLVAAGLPFLLQCSPLGLLSEETGAVGGVVFGSRSGPLLARARVVVDATVEGTLAWLLGTAPPQTPRGATDFVVTVLHEGDGRPLPPPTATILAEPPSLTGHCDGLSWGLTASRYVLRADAGNGSPESLAAVEVALADDSWQPGQFSHNEGLLPLAAWPGSPSAPVADDELRAAVAAIPNPCPSLWLAGAWSQATPRCLQCFSSPATALRLGELLAETIAAELAQTDNAWPAARLWHWGEAPAYDASAMPSGLGWRWSEDAPARWPERTPVVWAPKGLPRWPQAEVAVVGGGTGGCPAAIGAARAGAETLLLETGAQLGGVGTVGQIARYWCGNRVGFTSEIDRGVAAREVVPHLAEGTGSWSPSAKAAWFRATLRQAGVRLHLRSSVVALRLDGARVAALLVAGPYGVGVVEVAATVDATGRAELAAMAGGPTVQVGADHVAVQGTGLHGLVPGRPYANSDHNFCDDTDVAGVTAFFVASRRKFAGAFDSGQLVDSRERRQIVGDLTLGPLDFLAGRRYPDTVCVASSNFDSHGFTIHEVFQAVTPDKKRLWADVPFRVFLCRGLEGLLTTGLGLSCHRDALPVVRMQPDVQNHGYAMGYAAAQSARLGLPLRQLPLRPLQEHLVAIGNLPDRILTDTDNFPLPVAEVEAAAVVEPPTLTSAALLLAHPTVARPTLRRVLADTPPRSPAALYRARLLALLDDPAGVDLLRQRLATVAWDDGWNYRGMHQFGLSESAVDALWRALARVGDDGDWPLWQRWAEALLAPEATATTPAFSHGRALAEAAEALHRRHPAPVFVRQTLARLLQVPGLAGHAQPTLAIVQATLTPDPNENRVRNLALRELHLARALFRLGDSPEGLGRRLLEAYATDLRGHFARHAQAVLAERRAGGFPLVEGGATGGGYWPPASTSGGRNWPNASGR